MTKPQQPALPGAVVMPYKGFRPQIHDQALVLPNATVVGDVILGPQSSVWFGAVVRGDDGPIRIGEGTNVQDGTVIHVSDIHPTVIGAWVTIGHCVHLHACTLEDECLIGSGAVVLDGATVERHAQVAAGAVVSPGKTVRSGELWAGVPARKLRDLTPEEIATIRGNAEWYVHEVETYRQEIAALG